MKEKQVDGSNQIIKRLDALIRIQIESRKKEGTLKEVDAVRMLSSVGFTPTEIARVLGKKSRTDISRHLYSKEKRGKH